MSYKQNSRSCGSSRPDFYPFGCAGKTEDIVDLLRNMWYCVDSLCKSRDCLFLHETAVAPLRERMAGFRKGNTMTLQDVYEQIGGDYQTAISRLLKEERIEKYVLKFLNDTSFQDLRSAMAAEDWDRGFEAAHTLKGVTMNLAFADLAEAVVTLTDELRPANRAGYDVQDFQKSYAEVERRYQKVHDTITQYSQSVS